MLIAEDEEDVIRVLGEAFSASGCETVKVNTAPEALAALESQEFDLVVSDLMMPGGGGRAVLEFTSALDDPPPVTIITGRLEKSLQDEVIALGASHCLKKPFNLNDVLVMAQNLVKARRQ